MQVRILSSVLVLVLVSGMAIADTNILGTVNAQRSANGRASLTYDRRLEAVARAHAQDMATRGFFGHVGSDGSDLGKRLKRSGERYCFGAENVAYGQKSLATVMTAWMNSGGHRKNILHRKADSVGLARASGDRWVMVLGSRC